MSEEHGPHDLIDAAVRAEQAGFDFVTLSDHFHPWLFSQGESPFAWSVLGAIAARTERIEIMTAVTCPTIRYHPAIIAQAAATVALISDGRFALGLMRGDKLNEHVVGRHWPAPGQRLDMVAEAIEIIRALWSGGQQTHHGRFFELDSAELFTLPDVTPRSCSRAVASARSRSQRASPTACSPRSLPTIWWRGTAMPAAGSGARASRAVRAGRRSRGPHDRASGGGLGPGPVQANLPTPVALEAATSTVRSRGPLAQTCLGRGGSGAARAGTSRKWLAAGFTDVCVVQIGTDQESVLRSLGAGALPDAGRHRDRGRHDARRTSLSFLPELRNCPRALRNVRTCEGSGTWSIRDLGRSPGAAPRPGAGGIRGHVRGLARGPAPRRPRGVPGAGGTGVGEARPIPAAAPDHLARRVGALDRMLRGPASTWSEAEVTRAWVELATGPDPTGRPTRACSPSRAGSARIRPTSGPGT